METFLAKQSWRSTPTQVDQVDRLIGLAKTVREYLWAPLGISVSMQWIILGMFVGIAMVGGSTGSFNVYKTNSRNQNI